MVRTDTKKKAVCGRPTFFRIIRKEKAWPGKKPMKKKTTFMHVGNIAVAMRRQVSFTLRVCEKEMDFGKEGQVARIKIHEQELVSWTCSFMKKHGTCG